ncbi:MAG: hypothetical protein ACTHMM_13820 [Agriterribacter sp.]
MNFKFSKELIVNNTENGPNEQLRLYKIMDNKDQLMGQFFYYPKEQIINFNDRKISIEVVSKFLKKTKYFLVDNKDNKKVGEYEVLGGFGINYFWQDVPSSPTGTIQLIDTLFNFRRIPTDIKYSFSKKETWGYFKFRLYAIKGEEFYDYSLKIDIPVWSKPHFTKYRSFVGTIVSNADNVFAMLAGLYLMEIEFDYEDKEIDG